VGSVNRVSEYRGVGVTVWDESAYACVSEYGRTGVKVRQ